MDIASPFSFPATVVHAELPTPDSAVTAARRRMDGFGLEDRQTATAREEALEWRSLWLG